MGTLLVVEDEASIAALVRTYLRRDGHEVVWVTSGEAAIAELQRRCVTLAIVDVGLPGMDGFELCRRIAPDTPTILLTARDEEADRVLGLELGADDYVPKPFSPRELVARVRAVLRRGQRTPAGTDLLTAGPVTLSRRSREVLVDGREVALTRREFDLLAHLLSHAGVVVSRDRLLEEVWGYLAPGATRTVETHVAQVRRKLGTPDLIRTVRGSGYKVVT